MSHALTASRATADASDSEAGRQRPARIAARGGIAPRSTRAGARRTGRGVRRGLVDRAHATTSLGSRRTTSSAISRALVRCEMRSTVGAVVGEVADARATAAPRSSGSSAELGSSSAMTRRAPAQVAVERAGDGDALRLPARESGALHAELAASGSRSSAHASVSARATSRRVGRGVAEGDVVARSVPGDEPGLLAGPREPRRTARASRTSRAAEVAAPSKSAAPRRAAKTLDLPGAARSLEEGDRARARR